MQQELPFEKEPNDSRPPPTEEQIKENHDVIQAYIALALQVYMRLKSEGEEINK